MIELIDELLGDAKERMQKSVDAYRDPWQEGAKPATPGQFRTSLPLEVLPSVGSSRPAGLSGPVSTR